MAWLLLFIAIVFEVAGTTAMKLSNGFSVLSWSIAVFVFYAISLAAVAVAMKTLDLSIVYSIWAVAGTALIVMIGIYHFGEPFTPLKAVGLLATIIGVICLRIASSA
jgi:small multidrug resistance pump